MTTPRTAFENLTAYEAFRWAEALFAAKDHRAAAEVLEHLLGQPDAQADLPAVRELLARAYFHSAQLGRAEATARGILERDPTDAYAALLRYRALQRAGRHDEAAAARLLAEALGADTGG